MKVILIQDPPKPDRENPDTITVNGSVPNGMISTGTRNSPPNTKGSPKMRKARTMGDLPIVQFQESTDGPTAGSGSSTGDAELRRDSLSPPLMMASGTMTPSRKTMEAMRKVTSILQNLLHHLPLFPNVLFKSIIFSSTYTLAFPYL